MKRLLKTIRNSSSIKQGPNRSSSNHRFKANDVVGVTDATPPADEDYQDPGLDDETHPVNGGVRAGAASSNVAEELERYYPSASPVRTSAAPNRADETRNLVKKFIADIWNRGALDMIPVICSPSLRFNGNTGT